MSANHDTDRIARMRIALERSFAPRRLDIRDDSAAHAGHAGAREGGHFRVAIVAEAFEGRPSIERHRMVYAALAELMGRDIHAVSITAQAPSEAH